MSPLLTKRNQSTVLLRGECQTKGRSRELVQEVHKGKHQTQTILPVISRLKGYPPQDTPPPAERLHVILIQEGKAFRTLGITKPTRRLGPDVQWGLHFRK